MFFHTPEVKYIGTVAVLEIPPFLTEEKFKNFKT
jgi:hypothetical protein